MPFRGIALLVLSSIAIILCGKELYAQDGSGNLIEVDRYEGEMVNPHNFYVYDDARAIVIDKERRECAFSMVHMKDNKVARCYGIGQGPGEIQPQGMKAVYRFSDGRVWLTDENRSKVYSADLEFIGNVRNQKGSYSRLIPINDSTVVGTPFIGSEAFLHFFRLTDGNVLSEKPIRSVSLNESSPLAPVKQNFMLNQGPYTSRSGDVFVGFSYSSHLVRVDSAGVHYTTNDPAQIPFPDYDFRAGGGYEAPNSADFPECTMGITADERYVYVLHHGETFDIGPLRQVVAMARGRIAAKIEAWELTDRVFIYAKDTGNFVREINLPVKARKIQVTDEHLYVLTIDDGPATIITYQKPRYLR